MHVGGGGVQDLMITDIEEEIKRQRDKEITFILFVELYKNLCFRLYSKHTCRLAGTANFGSKMRFRQRIFCFYILETVKNFVEISLKEDFNK